ncbi:autotransporter domain-containing protein [Brucella intermedia]|uniref:autotransporter domain-containing protein n=2 Tax=Brucella intermedia TaxID=94625 RepID=UPI00224AE854|nr:autotransporter domain-containing protein [Brucella intermedia]
MQLSTALALVLALGATAEPARAQSVTAEGDVSPFPSQNPQPNWSVGGTLTVGNTSTGTLTITDGGRVENTYGFIGHDFGANGNSVIVSGTDAAGNASTWHNSGDIAVGGHSSGTLTIVDGGRVENTVGFIGAAAGATGSNVVVSGTSMTGNASTWKNSLYLFLGYESRGTLTIEDGGRVESTESFVGYLSGAADSNVTVSGTDAAGNASTWHNSGDIAVGFGGSGTLTIADGGKVSAGDGAGGTGTVYLGTNAAGTLNIGTVTGAADVGAGTLDAAKVEFRNGDGTINFNHVGETVFSAALVSNGSGTHAVNHLAGTTTLTGDSSGFSGKTTVSGGTLLVGDAADNVTLGGIVNVDANGALGGSGTLTGAVTIDGTLSAGNSPGTLTFDDALTLNASSTSRFELNSPGIAGGTGNDLVVVNGTLMLGGTLEAHVAAAGYYQLFDYSGGGSLVGTFNGGTLTGTGGFAPVNPDNPDIRYHIPGQVNLSVLGQGQTMQFWDGDTAGDGGGDGVWQGFATNWTDSDGNNPGGWGGSVGVFRGAAGIVAVQGTQVFDTLQFSTDGYVVEGDALAIGVAGGGTFNIEGGISTTIASVVQDGAGSALRKAGSGTLILTGNNTYSGGTSLLGGLVSVSADANLGAVGGDLSFDGGALQVTGTGYTTTDRAIAIGENGGGFDIADAANRFTLGQNIVGPGDLVKQGDGTLVLTGDNVYGNTLVQAGTLVGNAGSISGDIGNAGTLVFDQAVDASFAGDITGLNGNSGEMVKQGSGILTLGGASQLDWTIEAGGIVSAAERFGGSVDIWTGTSLAFDQGTDAAYAGILSGGGNFTKEGDGALLLTGDSSAFAGTTTITDGTLLVGNAQGNGSLGGSLDVLDSAILGGSGTVGSGTGSLVKIASGGTLTPGNSIGTLRVNGDLAFETGARFAVEVNPEGSYGDLVTVTGTATINGGSVAHIGASGNYDIRSTYTILSAGTLTGAFEDVTSDFAFLSPDLIYDYGDGTVDLRLTRNDIDFESAALTRNQIATANGIESMGISAGHAVYDAIAQLTDDTDLIRASFDALSGEVHASAKTALIEDSRFVRNAANDRIRAAFDNAGASYAPVLAYGPGDDPVLVSADHAGQVFWSQGFGSWGSTDSDGNAADLERSTGGLLIGADGIAGDWRIGLLAGYSHSSFDMKDRASSGKSDSYHLSLYGGTQWGNVAFRTGAAYSWHDIDTSRAVAIPGIGETLSAGYSAGTFQAFGEFGYGIDTGTSARFEPFINLAHVSLHSNGFTEQGGAAALAATSSTTNVTFATLGFRGEHNLALGAVDATLHGMIGWRHAFGDITPQSTHAFSTGDTFTIAGVPIARNSAVVEAGLDLNLTPKATFGVSYTGQLAADAYDHGFKANLNVRF